MNEVTVHRFTRILPSSRLGAVFPDGYALQPFSPLHHAPAVHALLVEGYSKGGGWVADYDDWWRSLSEDAEYDPDLVFVLSGPGGDLVAVAICWTSAFVKDLVVAREARRRGLGSTLLAHIFNCFDARGAAAVSLKVDAHNGPAIALYRGTGMECVETLMTSG